MKNWFRWHVIILIKKPHFFLFWKNKIDFFLQTRSWIVKHILFDTMLCYTTAIICIICRFSYSKRLDLTKNFSYLYHFSLFFKNITHILTVKKHNVYIIYAILSHTCPRIALWWYKTVSSLNEWTCKVKKTK